MDKLFYTISNTNDIKAEYEAITNPKLKLVFGFMVATMFRFGLIKIDEDFGAKLYIEIVNGHDTIKDVTDKIYDFVWEKVVNDAIDAIEKEINE